jgi:hypothetical protein
VDVARNEMNNGIRYVAHFLNRNIKTTVIILDVPHRFGLVNSSCVNIENIVYKRKLQKIVKTSNYMQIQNMIETEYATLSVECICIHQGKTGCVKKSQREFLICFYKKKL